MPELCLITTILNRTGGTTGLLFSSCLSLPEFPWCRHWERDLSQPLYWQPQTSTVTQRVNKVLCNGNPAWKRRGGLEKRSLGREVDHSGNVLRLCYEIRYWMTCMFVPKMVFSLFSLLFSAFIHGIREVKDLQIKTDFYKPKVIFFFPLPILQTPNLANCAYQFHRRVAVFIRCRGCCCLRQRDQGWITAAPH